MLKFSNREKNLSPIQTFSFDYNTFRLTLTPFLEGTTFLTLIFLTHFLTLILRNLRYTSNRSSSISIYFENDSVTNNSEYLQ